MNSALNSTQDDQLGRSCKWKETLMLSNFEYWKHHENLNVLLSAFSKMRIEPECIFRFYAYA